MAISVRLLASWGLAWGLCLGMVGSLAAQQAGVAERGEVPDGRGVNQLQELTRQWVETLRLVGQERAQWQLEQQQMKDLNALRERELEMLDGVLEASGDRAPDMDERLRALERQQQRLLAVEQVLRDEIGVLEGRLRGLVQRMPVPLREQLQPSMVRLNAPDVDAGLAERFRTVVTILDDWVRFGAGVHVFEQTLPLGEEMVEVSVLYLGNDLAYYVDRLERRAGWGVPSADGWVWQADDAAAARVRQAIEVHEQQAAPVVVELPMELSQG